MKNETGVGEQNIHEKQRMERIEVDGLAPNEGIRADKYLAGHLLSLTRSRLQKLFDEKLVLCNGKVISKNWQVKNRDILSVAIPPPCEPNHMKPEQLPFTVVYEDEDLLVVDKPKGMVVHPAPGNATGTLANGLLYHCKGRLSGINGVIRPGIVHRIDKNTSGLLIVAKNDTAHQKLALQIKAHSFVRAYMAVIYGSLPQDKMTINAPIGRSTKNRMKMAVTEKNAKPAVTHCYTVQKFRGFSMIRCELETGRTHQIRVHLSSIGHPLAGDDVYGPKKGLISELNGQCLHAFKIGFVHPVSGQFLEFESPLPAYFTNFIKKINNGADYEEKV